MAELIARNRLRDVKSLAFPHSPRAECARDRHREERRCTHKRRDPNRVLDRLDYVGLTWRSTHPFRALRELCAENNKERKMKFLINTRLTVSPPPEMMPALIDAMTAWTNRFTESGKLEAVWSYAGLAGGGGIANVDSLEELDASMVEFPFGLSQRLRFSLWWTWMARSSA